MEKNLIVTASPHIVDRSSTRRLMRNVIIALLPCVVASAWIFGLRALLVEAVAVFACVAFEYLYCYLMKKPIPVGDLSAVVTGLILAMNVPVTLPLWMVVLGSFVAIVITKQLFGGLGFNLANPALMGRLVLFGSFTGAMTNWTFPRAISGTDALAGATPLVAGQTDPLPVLDLFLGVHGGVLGETCALAILLGFIWLVATRTISPAIPLAYVGTVAVLALVFVGPSHVMLHVLGGGLLFGAVFMATDYVTSPFTLKGKIVFGIGLGIITWAIRYWGNMAEGVSYAILLMNLFVPYINDLTRQKPLGGVKKK